MDEYKSIGGYVSTNRHRFENYPFQFLWVFLSGKEIINRKRFFKPSSITHLWTAFIYLAVGAIGVAVFLESKNIVYLLLSQLFIVGGSRYMITTNMHMMSHGVFFNKKKIDFIFCEVLTTVFFVQSCQNYRADHLNHHGKSFGSTEDGDAQQVVDLGFVSGKSKAQLWLHLLVLCVSPLFHFQSLKSRFIDNFWLCSNTRKVMSVSWLLILGIGADYIGFEWLFWAYLFPVLFLCQIATLLQLICEHIWISTTLTPKQCHVQLTNGRYCGTEFPSTKSWTPLFLFDCCIWLLRNILIELPIRIAVFQGTVPSHDWHHQFCGSRKWPDSAMLREEHIQKQLAEKGVSTYTEIWGTIEIIDNVFTHISQSIAYPEKPCGIN
ncbi:fatty acid desaturase [Neptunomonas sp.]|uniref:fatty acid desaturase n=1 Tax=Neptunomonas sp. TaxID=1971898 RepID=UPI0025CBC671|nr:fatty acid desaturase [Neptunomonas sp.]